MTLRRLAIATEQLDPQDQQRVNLTAEQVHYLRQVLRLRSGDPFLALLADRGLWLTILGESPQDAHLQAPYPDRAPLTLQATLLVALPKNGFDEVVRQSVELGVKAIVPLISERTILRPSPQKQNRWQRIAQEAAEQCERQEVPAIAPPLPFAQGLQFISPTQPRFLGVTRQAAPRLLTVLQDLPLQMAQTGEVAIATGPEGGWTAEEVQQALELGYQAVSLGSLILRAVTAPIAALSIVMAVGDAMGSSEHP